jgi:hypothetical protein
MSDSASPDEGLAPEQERDLEALLSGPVGTVPGGRRQVRAALTALRAGPRPGELNGEAAAMAAFRLFVLPEGNWPPRTGDETVAPSAARRRRRAARPLSGPRHRGRQGSRPGRRRPALLGAGAVAAGLIALLFVLVLPGHQAGTGQDAAAGPGPTPASGAAVKLPQLQGSGTREPSPSPSAARSQPGSAAVGPTSAAALCQQYFALPENHGKYNRAAANSILRQLGKELGGSRQQALAYCLTLHDSGQPSPEAGNAGLPDPARGPNDSASGAGPGSTRPGARQAIATATVGDQR